MNRTRYSWARLALCAVFALIVAGWAGCTKKEEAPKTGDAATPAGTTGLTGDPTKPPEDKKTVDVLNPPDDKKPDDKKPVDTKLVELVPPTDTTKPADAREGASKAIASKLDAVFGRQGLQTPEDAKKFDEAWDKAVEPLLRTSFKDYKDKYPVTVEAAGGPPDKKKKKKGEGPEVPDSARRAIEDKVKAITDPQWKVDEADLKKAEEAVAEAFKTATNRELGAASPDDKGKVKGKDKGKKKKGDPGKKKKGDPGKKKKGGDKKKGGGDEPVPTPPADTPEPAAD